MRFVVLLPLLFVLSPLQGQASCEEWFQKAEIKNGKECVVKCSVIPVGMGTFNCPSQCPELCSASLKEKYLFKLTDLYPGLTAKEKALASQSPLKVLKAYQLSWNAETKCLEAYTSSETNDESDACRHFLWAGFLLESMGREFSTDILDAHEQEPTQPEAEKAMDLANNRRGLSVAEDLIKEGQFSENEMLVKFQKELKSGNLIILSPRTKKE